MIVNDTDLTETPKHKGINKVFVNDCSGTLKIGSVGDIEVLYCTSGGQLFFRNACSTMTYNVQLTLVHTNTNVLGVIPHHTIQKGFGDEEGLRPGEIFYLTFTGKYDEKFNVLCPNEKVIAEDLTFICGDTCYGINLNNQNIGEDQNRILMSIVETNIPSAECSVQD